MMLMEPRVTYSQLDRALQTYSSYREVERLG